MEVELHQPKDLLFGHEHVSTLWMKELDPAVSGRSAAQSSEMVREKNARFIKRLNREDMKECMHKGLCFNYDEPFIQEH